MISFGWFIAGPLIYIAGAVFICVSAYKIVAILRMPRPFRWDLYPLPHRGPAGSKYQKLDFSRQKVPSFLGRELWEMAQEIFFIKRLFANNLRLWLGSYPMHTGIYLGFLWIILLIVGAIIQINTNDFNSAAVDAFFFITTASGIAALVLGTLGSFYLLIYRYSNSQLRIMSDKVSYFNLWLMIALFGSALAAWLAADNSFSHLRGQIAGLITLKPTAPHHPLVTIEFFFLGVFLIYLPFSRMLHFAAKYFFYHNIMWDDETMQPGSKLERQRKEQLAWQLQWRASHIKAEQSWLDQVNDEQEQGDQNSK